MDPKRAIAKAQAVVDAYVDVFGEHITRGELLYLLCVAEHETHCGDDWKDRLGNPLHNWGAVQWRVPTADERLRIQAGDLVKGSTIPGGVLEEDYSPNGGNYWVWFRTFLNDRAGAGFLVTTLYKHNPEARAVAAAGGKSIDFCTAMYRRGYYENTHPTPAEKAAGMKPARPVYGPKGEILRTDPLLPAEAENVRDYTSSVDKLMPEWLAALKDFPLVNDAPPAPEDPSKAAQAATDAAVGAEVADDPHVGV